MIRRLTSSSRLLKCFRMQPQFLMPAGAISAIRLQSGKSPETESFISEKAKRVLNAGEEIKESKYKTMLDDLVRCNKVVVFMKGTPKSPRCGFSNAVVQIFRMHGVSYDAHDVLADDQLRESIKAYSDWPTIPQVYINGEFVGGCDILLEMHQNGELVEHLSKAGIQSDLLRLQKEAGQTGEPQRKNKKK